MPDYTVRVALARPAIVVGVRSHAYTVEVPELHTYTVETGLAGGGSPTPAAPVNVTPPTASGAVRIGEVLSSDDGVWTNSPTGYSYQWTRDSVDIGGETANTYTTVAADIDAEIRCEVTATNAGGSSTPEPSNSLSSPWRDILVARPGVLIYDHTDPYCSGGASVGDPVSEIRTVDGVVIGTQATSGSRPTRTSGGLSYDGLDDHLVCDTHAGLFDGAHTLIAGWSTPQASGTAMILGAALATSTSTARQIRLSYAQTGTAGARRVYYHDGSTSINLSLTTLGTGDEDIAARSAAPGGAASAVKLDASLTAISSGTRPGGSNAHTLLTLGVLRYGAGPSITGYWQGVIRHLALDDEQWDDTDTLLYRTCAIAAGVM